MACWGLFHDTVNYTSYLDQCLYNSRFCCESKWNTSSSYFASPFFCPHLLPLVFLSTLLRSGEKLTVLGLNKAHRHFKEIMPIIFKKIRHIQLYVNIYTFSFFEKEDRAPIRWFQLGQAVTGARSELKTGAMNPDLPHRPQGVLPEWPLLPVSALAGSWSQGAELGIEPKHSKMDIGIFDQLANTHFFLTSFSMNLLKLCHMYRIYKVCELKMGSKFHHVSNFMTQFLLPSFILHF